MKVRLDDDGTTSTPSEKHILEIVPDRQFGFRHERAQILFNENLIGYAEVTTGGFLCLNLDKSIPLGNVRIHTIRGWKTISELDSETPQ